MNNFLKFRRKITFSLFIWSVLISYVDICSGQKKWKSSYVPACSQNENAAKSVAELNLVDKSPNILDIISCHDKFTSRRSSQVKTFQSDLLGFVTPWNNHGYDVAKYFTNKFNYISPVWLQLRRTGKDTYEVTGQHDVDKKWMKDLRTNNKNVKVVPRLLFDGWSAQDFTALFKHPSETESLCKSIEHAVKGQNFDGIVLELWSQLGGQARDHLSKLIKSIANHLKKLQKYVILVIPPPVYHGNVTGMFSAIDFENTKRHVQGFVLMSYDYSNSQRPGPNSPIHWVRQCIEMIDPNNDPVYRSKILMGLNFYGNDYTAEGGGPIVGSRYLELMKYGKQNNLKWDDHAGEHFIELRDKSKMQHTIFYPTLYSIKQRIDLAVDLGVGLAIWEIGQGLDYFYDLF